MRSSYRTPPMSRNTKSIEPGTEPSLRAGAPVELVDQIRPSRLGPQAVVVSRAVAVRRARRNQTQAHGHDPVPRTPLLVLIGMIHLDPRHPACRHLLDQRIRNGVSPPPHAGVREHACTAGVAGHRESVLGREGVLGYV